MIFRQHRIGVRSSSSERGLNVEFLENEVKGTPHPGVFIFIEFQTFRLLQCEGGLPTPVNSFVNMLCISQFQA